MRAYTNPNFPVPASIVDDELNYLLTTDPSEAQPDYDDNCMGDEAFIRMDVDTPDTDAY